MNIGVIVDNEYNNDKRVEREAGILKDAGHSVYVLCFGFGGKSYPGQEGIEISRIRINRKLKDILFFFQNRLPAYEKLWSRRISRFIKEKNLGFLHVHDLYMSKAASEGIRCSGKKVSMVLDLHENYPYAVTSYNWSRGLVRNFLARPNLWQKKEREYLSYADKIIVLSEDYRDVLTEKYPELLPGRFGIIPNVPDIRVWQKGSEVPAKANVREGTTVVLYFGVIAERRGVFDVLEVYSELAAERFPSVFLVIGPVDKRDRKRFFSLIKSPDLRDNVHYVPPVGFNELPSYLDISDICLAPFHRNPQHESGIANKIFDYLLGKKPVIVSDCKPQKRLVEKYACGLVYSDNKGMKEAIRELSANPGMRIRMGENGFRAVTEELNSDMIRKPLADLFSNV